MNQLFAWQGDVVRWKGQGGKRRYWEGAVTGLVGIDRGVKRVVAGGVTGGSKVVERCQTLELSYISKTLSHKYDNYRSVTILNIWDCSFGHRRDTCKTYFF